MQKVVNYRNGGGNMELNTDYNKAVDVARKAAAITAAACGVDYGALDVPFDYYITTPRRRYVAKIAAPLDVPWPHMAAVVLVCMVNQRDGGYTVETVPFLEVEGEEGYFDIAAAPEEITDVLEWHGIDVTDEEAAAFLDGVRRLADELSRAFETEFEKAAS